MTGRTVAVVGGGIIGCLTARAIVDRVPDASVTVIEQDAVASGASRRAAGVHVPRGATGPVREMSAFSQEYYLRLHAQHPDLPIHPLDMYVLGKSADGYLDAADLTPVDRMPFDGIDRPDGAGLWRGTGCHYADVPAVTAAIARQLRSRVSFREGVAGTDLRVGDRGVAVHLSSGETVEADAVVLAPGPWLDAPAWRALLEPLGLRTKKIVALHLELPVADADPIVMLEDEDAFLLPMRHRGHWLFSWTCQEWDVTPETVGSLTPADLDGAVGVLRRYAPRLVERVRGGRVFCDAYNPRLGPVIEAVGGTASIVFAGAAGGSGYRLGPAIAARAADLVTGEGTFR